MPKKKLLMDFCSFLVKQIMLHINKRCLRKVWDSLGLAEMQITTKNKSLWRHDQAPHGNKLILTGRMHEGCLEFTVNFPIEKSHCWWLSQKVIKAHSSLMVADVQYIFNKNKRQDDGVVFFFAQI